MTSMLNVSLADKILCCHQFSDNLSIIQHNRHIDAFTAEAADHNASQTAGLREWVIQFFCSQQFQLPTKT